MSDSYRLGQLLGMTVESETGRQIGRVQDVRVATETEHADAPLSLVGLMVGERNTGALLGYDRDRTRGPWPVRALVRWLHRNAVYVDWDNVVDIDWQEKALQVREREYPRLLHGE